MGPVLRVALQKSGRLSEESASLMGECGITFEANRGNSRLRSAAFNFPVEFLFLRDDDIPGYVEDGVADAGVIGENVLVEKARRVSVAARLGFSRCRLALAVPRDSRYQSVQDLRGARIATSYPRTLSEYLKGKGIEAELHEISGSVEIAPSIGLAEAICDIVGSGSTLISNSLREIETVLESEAVLVANEQLPADKAALLEKLLFRIRAVQKAKTNKYIVLNAPNERIPDITALLPGMKSPTVVPLAMSGWSSIHSVVKEDQFWEIIENLKAAGAQGILVVPIEKMIV